MPVIKVPNHYSKVVETERATNDMTKITTCRKFVYSYNNGGRLQTEEVSYFVEEGLETGTEYDEQGLCDYVIVPKSMDIEFV